MDALKTLEDQLPLIEEKLKITFADKSLLKLAFIHRSFANEYRREQMEHNERLEFLGDAVLGLIVSSLLYKLFPDVREGELSQLRSRLVDANACQNYLYTLELHEYMLLGKGEQQNLERGRNTLHSDLFEAIVGAIYLDRGWKETKEFFQDHFLSIVQEIQEKPEENFKAVLQDYSQKNYQTQPEYILESETGPEHEKEFYVKVCVNQEIVGEGKGSSKKIAQQKAAKEACEKLGIGKE